MARTARSAAKFLEGDLGFNTFDCIARPISDIDKSKILELIKNEEITSKAFVLTDSYLSHFGFKKTYINGNDVYILKNKKYIVQNIFYSFDKSITKNEKIVIKSAADVLKLIESDDVGNWIFRGQHQASWMVEATIHRIFLGRNVDKSRYIELERYVLNEFKRRSRFFLSSLPQNDWEWLILAQHFGVPTRLLDWTENPLVALYFAVRNLNQTIEDGVIYAMRPGLKYVDVSRGEDPFAITEIKAIRPGYLDHRMLVQRSILTVEPPRFLDERKSKETSAGSLRCTSYRKNTCAP